MPTLSTLARITRRGTDDTPPGITLRQHSQDDTAETRAWLIYTAMTEQGKAIRTSDSGRPIVEANVKALARDLYPLTIDWSDPNAVADFMRPVYSYLRATGNAKVEQRNINGQPYRTYWSLSPEWTTGPATPARPAIVLTRSEKKVTATEAGEDRSPEPVVVTVPQEDTVQQTAEDKAEAKRERDRQRKRDANARKSGAKYKMVNATTARCTFDGCEFKGAVAQVIGHYGSKHSRWDSALTKEERASVRVSGRAVPQADGTWGCPVTDCDFTTETFRGIGGHMGVHRDKKAAVKIASSKATTTLPAVTVSTGSSNSTSPTAPDVTAALDVLVDFVTNGGSSAEVDTLRESLALVTAERDRALATVLDQQARIDKMRRALDAALGAE